MYAQDFNSDVYVGLLLSNLNLKVTTRSRKVLEEKEKHGLEGHNNDVCIALLKTTHWKTYIRNIYFFQQQFYNMSEVGILCYCVPPHALNVNCFYL